MRRGGSFVPLKVFSYAGALPAFEQAAGPNALAKAEPLGDRLKGKIGVQFHDSAQSPPGLATLTRQRKRRGEATPCRRVLRILLDRFPEQPDRLALTAELYQGEGPSADRLVGSWVAWAGAQGVRGMVLRAPR